MVFHNVGTVFPIRVGATASESAAVDPQHDGHKVLVLRRWSVYIQGEAILRCHSILNHTG